MDSWLGGREILLPSFSASCWEQSHLLPARVKEALVGDIPTAGGAPADPTCRPVWLWLHSLPPLYFTVEMWSKAQTRGFSPQRVLIPGGSSVQLFAETTCCFSIHAVKRSFHQESPGLHLSCKPLSEKISEHVPSVECISVFISIIYMHYCTKYFVYYVIKQKI